MDIVKIRKDVWTPISPHVSLLTLAVSEALYILIEKLASPAPADNCGFNGGAFVGGMFLMGGIILLGIIGYAFYRWRTGNRIQYT